MGYFNYFIKCIIRNVTYKLCKPKVFLTVLLSVAILFVLHSTGYCAEWSDEDIDTVLLRLDDIQYYITESYGAIENINSHISTLDDRQQLIFNEVKTMHSDMLSKFDKLQAGVSELNTNLVYCLTNLQQIKKLATDMSGKLDLLQARFERN